MKYNRVGRSGLKVSELSLGSWLTFGVKLDEGEVKSLMHIAFDHGINFFDNAETYADGAAERLMGAAMRDFRREDLVISTKIFWGGGGPNDTGLSRKHLIEGTVNSLKRLQTEYVDILFCHRPDPNVPMDEVVSTMDMLIRRGLAFYWGTSEWPATAIEEARRVAEANHYIQPIVEQTQYSLFSRARVEVELRPLIQNAGLGLTTFSPLACGMLTGKYDDNIPEHSRLDRVEWLREARTPESVRKSRALGALAREIGSTQPQLAIAWCLANPAVNTVVLGASSESQLKENLGAVEVHKKLDGTLLARIDALMK